MNHERVFQPPLLSISCFAVLSVLSASIILAADRWPNPVGRISTSRDDDLIAQLLDSEQFVTVDELCQHFLQSAGANSDSAAKWSVRYSQSLTAQALRGEDFSDHLVNKSTEPVADLLAAYPAHPRALFLFAQILDVKRLAAHHDVVIFSASRHNQAVAERGLMRLTRVATEIQKLAIQVSDALAMTNRDAPRSRTPAGSTSHLSSSLANDLLKLERQLKVQAVQAMLVRTEIFGPGSPDFLAAAALVEQAATKALAVLPNDSPGRLKVQQFRIEAILRSGDVSRARSVLQKLTAELTYPSAPSLTALQIRMDVAEQNLSSAVKRVAEYYNGDPLAAAKSLDVDLAALQTLLARDASNGKIIANWINVIEQRGGTYARRRAEAIVISKLGDSANHTSSNPSLIAAQGQDWLRRGNPLRAARLLAEAARSEPDTKTAVVRAIESAAAFAAAQEPKSAAGILRDVALMHPIEPQASAAFMQSILILAKSSGDSVLIEIQQGLRTLLNTWPMSTESKKGRQWLLKILLAQGKIVDGAEIAMPPPGQGSAPEASDFHQANELWSQVFYPGITNRSPDPAGQQSSKGQRAKLVGRLHDAFAPHLEDPSGQAALESISLVLLDLDELTERPVLQSETFAAKFLAFRRSNDSETSFARPPENQVQRCTWRLMQDGRQKTHLQNRNATTIQRWQNQASADQADISIGAAERLLWQGQIEPAITMLQQLIRDATNQTPVLKAAAQLLGGTSDSNAKNMSVKLWDQLASGFPQGSSQWHEAKLAAIAVLAKTNQRESAKRAKYILLTSPPTDSSLRSQYQEAAN